MKGNSWQNHPFHWPQKLPTKPVKCSNCGAHDSRDAAHARGCPKLAPLTKEQLIAIAREAEAEWERRNPKPLAAGAAA